MAARLAGALAVGAVLGALAACAGSPGAQDPGTVQDVATGDAADPGTAPEDAEDTSADEGGRPDVAPDVAPELPAGDPGTDPGIPPGACGDGQVVAPEACEPLDTKPCTDFGFNFTGGNAWCRDDCTGWSFTACLTDGTAVCGNGRKESAAGVLEFCDTAAAPCPPLAEDPACFDGVKHCKDLGPGWWDGTAACSADCRTADVSGCTTTIPPFGTLAGSWQTPYVLSEPMLPIAGYLSAHKEGLVGTPAFTGDYAGGVPIPSPDPARTVSYAVRNVRKLASGGWYDQVYVIQETAVVDGGTTAFTGAQLELRFRDGPLQAGTDYPVNAGVMGANRLYLFRYTNPDGSGTPDGSLRCLAAVGVGGRVRVTKADGLYGEGGTPSTDGGTLAFEASGITLYWLDETPYGQDLAGDFKKPGGVNGVGMCARTP